MNEKYLSEAKRIITKMRGLNEEHEVRDPTDSEIKHTENHEHDFLETQKDLYETAHVVHIKYDDPSGKGTASIRVPVNAKNPEHAKKKAMDKISRFPHPISGYKNAVVHRVETKKAVKK